MDIIHAPDWYHLADANRIEEKIAGNFRIVQAFVKRNITDKYHVFHILPESEPVNTPLTQQHALSLLGLMYSQNCPYEKTHQGCYSFAVQLEIDPSGVVFDHSAVKSKMQLNSLHQNLSSIINLLQNLHRLVQGSGLQSPFREELEDDTLFHHI